MTSPRSSYVDYDKHVHPALRLVLRDAHRRVGDGLHLDALRVPAELEALADANGRDAPRGGVEAEDLDAPADEELRVELVEPLVEKVVQQRLQVVAARLDLAGCGGAAVDVNRLRPLGRLGGNTYCRVGSTFDLPRPDRARSATPA